VRILRRAASLVGGPSALSALLGVSRQQLARWMSDQAVPPLQIFLRAVDFMVLTDCTVLGPSAAAQRLSLELTSHLQR